MVSERKRGRPPHEDVLTPGEWRVVELVRHGLGNAAIARRLNISRDGVKYHVSNALQKIGLNRREQLRSWDGIRRDSNLGGKGKRTEMIRLGMIGQVSRTVSDIGKSVAWYRDVLELPHLFTTGHLAFFDCDGLRLFLEEGEPGPESVLYFKVSDIRSSHAEMVEKGVNFPHGPHLIHRHDDGLEEWMAFFEDPDGRLLALMSQIPPAQSPD